jgi:hypothetical protein
MFTVIKDRPARRGLKVGSYCAIAPLVDSSVRKAFIIWLLGRLNLRKKEIVGFLRKRETKRVILRKREIKRDILWKIGNKVGYFIEKRK